jgi:hypothetical protein
MTAADQPLVSLALLIGQMSARDMDLPAVLRRICTALPAATGVPAAVLFVTEPAGEPTLVASDINAGRIGEAQRRAGVGPLLDVAKSGRRMHTADLSRLGLPVLAAAAAATGLTSSLVVPLLGTGESYGGVQLLGDRWRRVEPTHADAARPLLAALVARLVDVRALRVAGERTTAASQPATDMATTAVPTAIPAMGTTAIPAMGTTAIPTAGPRAPRPQPARIPSRPVRTPVPHAAIRPVAHPLPPR